MKFPFLGFGIAIMSGGLLGFLIVEFPKTPKTIPSVMASPTVIPSKLKHIPSAPTPQPTATPYNALSDPKFRKALDEECLLNAEKLVIHKNMGYTLSSGEVYVTNIIATVKSASNEALKNNVDIYWNKP